MINEFLSNFDEYCNEIRYQKLIIAGLDTMSPYSYEQLLNFLMKRMYKNI